MHGASSLRSGLQCFTRDKRVSVGDFRPVPAEATQQYVSLEDFVGAAVPKLSLIDANAPKLEDFVGAAVPKLNLVGANAPRRSARRSYTTRASRSPSPDSAFGQAWTEPGSPTEHRRRCRTKSVRFKAHTDVDVWQCEEDDDEAVADAVTSWEDAAKFKVRRSSSADTIFRKSSSGSIVTIGPSSFARDLHDPVFAPELFEKPCSPIATSGGTAAFYRVRFLPKKKPENISPDKYIGKNVDRAIAEVRFYDALRTQVESEKCGQDCSPWEGLAGVTLDSPGLCRLPCITPDGAQMMDLLLMENLNCGFDCLRLCDIKLGEETAIANWQGKSRMSAQSNTFVDRRTNSFGEGLRLEGMDHPPHSLRSRLLAVTDEGKSVSKIRKKFLGDKVSQRCVLQRLHAAEFLAAWLDVSSLGHGCESHAHGAAWGALEELTRLVRVVSCVPWPQQWIGSSIGLGMDVSSISTQPRVLLKLFDWGRSELWCETEFSRLTSEKKREGVHYWQQYVGAVCRLHWELARIVTHRCCCPQWAIVFFEICTESLSVVRSLLMGNTSQEENVLGVSFIKVPAGQLVTTEYELPLYVQNSRGVLESGKAGVLRIRLTKVARSWGGVALRVDICNVAKMQHKPTSSSTIVAKAVAFRCEDDAQIHLEARARGQPSPLPCGRACSQATAPCRVENNLLNWDSTLEFVELCDDAATSQKRLSLLVPECVAGANPARVVNDVLWPELLPPPFVNVDEARAFSLLWSKQLVPWLDDEDECPSDWLPTSPMPTPMGKAQADVRRSSSSFFRASFSGAAPRQGSKDKNKMGDDGAAPRQGSKDKGCDGPRRSLLQVPQHDVSMTKSFSTPDLSSPPMSPLTSSSPRCQSTPAVHSPAFVLPAHLRFSRS